MVSVDDPLFEYVIPAEPGSSGSPLFDDEWAVVGFHRGRSLNPRGPDLRHGVSLARVVERARQDLSAS